MLFRNCSSFILIALLCFSLLGCTQSYPSLNELYDDFARVLKADNEKELRDFCMRLAVDENVMDYMRKNGLDYRGIPNQMGEHGKTIQDLADVFYPPLARIQERLKSEGLLNDLKHTSPAEGYKSEIIDVEKGIQVEAMETDIVFQSGNTKIYYLMGEVIKVNGKWCLFTRPNVDYYTSSE